MLHLGKKGSILVVLVSYFLFSCSGNKKQDSVEITELYKKKSIGIIGLDTYNTVWHLANDTLHSWINNKLSITSAYRNSNWRLDSLVCFNRNKDKSVMCVYHQESLTTNNALDFFYGVKIKEKWYFFEGPVVYAFSESYGYPKNTPLPFSKLHEIAIQELFHGYLKKDDKGQWQINDAFFGGMENSNAPTTTGYGSCFSCKTFDEYVLYLVKRNWQERDTTR